MKTVETDQKFLEKLNYNVIQFPEMKYTSLKTVKNDPTYIFKIIRNDQYLHFLYNWEDNDQNGLKMFRDEFKQEVCFDMIKKTLAEYDKELSYKIYDDECYLNKLIDIYSTNVRAYLDPGCEDRNMWAYIEYKNIEDKEAIFYIKIRV